jgi:hypothetical protein
VKDINVKAFSIAKRGEVEEQNIEAEYVEPTTWELFSPASIRLSEIQKRRFNILDRTQEKIRIGLQLEEDDQFLALLETTGAANIAVNPYVSSTAGCSKTFLNDLSATIMDHDLPCYAFLMRFNSFKDIRDWNNNELDPVSMREVLQTGLYGSIWGIDLIVSRLVEKGRVWSLSEPRFFGVLPIRTDVILMPNDVPTEAKIGYVGYEEIGMTAVNANGISRGDHTG